MVDTTRGMARPAGSRSEIHMTPGRTAWPCLPLSETTPPNLTHNSHLCGARGQDPHPSTKSVPLAENNIVLISSRHRRIDSHLSTADQNARIKVYVWPMLLPQLQTNANACVVHLAQTDLPHVEAYFDSATSVWSEPVVVENPYINLHPLASGSSFGNSMP